MKTIDIRLSTIQDVQNFVNIVNRYDIDVEPVVRTLYR